MKPFYATAHQFLTAIDQEGNPSSAQPSFSDLAGDIAINQLPVVLQEMINEYVAANEKQKQNNFITALNGLNGVQKSITITRDDRTVTAKIPNGARFSRLQLNKMKCELEIQDIRSFNGYYHAKVNPIQAHDFLNFNTMDEPVLLDGVSITIDPAVEAGTVTLWA